MSNPRRMSAVDRPKGRGGSAENLFAIGAKSGNVTSAYLQHRGSTENGLRRRIHPRSAHTLPRRYGRCP
jgi:hypothetical protein